MNEETRMPDAEATQEVHANAQNTDSTGNTTDRQGLAESAADGRPVRRSVRLTLLALGPLVALLAGGYFYFTGGRYVSTENAYVHADMVAVSPQVSGVIDRVMVHENERIAAGTPLFTIDPDRYRIAVEQAKANLAATRQSIAALKATYKQQADSLQLAKIKLAYAKRTFERQSALKKHAVVSQSALDDAANAVDTARQQVVLASQAMQTTLADLGGRADTRPDRTPQVRKAQAALDDAELNLGRTTVKAPFAGIVGNKPQPGQYVAPGSAVMSIVSDRDVWVEANFKEIDVTHVRPGQKVKIWVDAYPDQIWQGTVGSLAPATGAEFSVLPAQNATGNWVKVVQRIPVRIKVANSDPHAVLRAGMSTDVEIDTGRKRSLPGFLKTLAGWFRSAAGNKVAQARTAAVVE